MSRSFKLLGFTFCQEKNSQHTANFIKMSYYVVIGKVINVGFYIFPIGFLLHKTTTYLIYIDEYQ